MVQNEQFRCLPPPPLYLSTKELRTGPPLRARERKTISEWYLSHVLCVFNTLEIGTQVLLTDFNQATMLHPSYTVP